MVYLPLQYNICVDYNRVLLLSACIVTTAILVFFVTWMHSYHCNTCVCVYYLHVLLYRLVFQLVELHFIGENIDGNVDWSPKSPSALVVVEDGIEAGPVPIEEVLVAAGVEIPVPLAGVPEEGPCESLDGRQLRLEPQSADVDRYPLGRGGGGGSPGVTSDSVSSPAEGKPAAWCPVRRRDFYPVGVEGIAGLRIAVGTLYQRVTDGENTTTKMMKDDDDDEDER